MEDEEVEHLEKQMLKQKEDRHLKFLFSACLGTLLISPFIGCIVTKIFGVTVSNQHDWILHLILYFFFGLISILLLVATLIMLIILGSTIVYCAHQIYSVYTNWKVRREEEHLPLL